MITIDVKHDGLGRLARVTAPVKALAERRVASLSQRWEAAMARRRTVFAEAGVPESLFKLDAEERTRQAEEKISALTGILFSALQHSACDWTLQYDSSEFAETPPAEPGAPPVESEPQRGEFKRQPLTLMTLLNPKAFRRRKEEARAKFESAHNAWNYLKRWREQEYGKAFESYRAAAAEWQQRKALFADSQARANARLDALVRGYHWGEAEAVAGYCDLALLSLERPEGFPLFWTTSFADGVVQIDYDLPSMAQVPVLKAVKYLASRQSFETVALSEKERERLYCEAVFQTTLAVLHTLFAADQAGVIRAVNFNGWANFVDAAAMRPGRACILSLTVNRANFAAIDLAAADPKACFRALNGVTSPKLAALVERTAG